MNDLHIHTRLCGHASGEMEEYVQAALNAGLQEMGFSDHIPVAYFDGELKNYSMDVEQLPGYVAEIDRLRKAYSDITILRGMEVDFLPGTEKKMMDIIKGYKWDYLIGGVHFMDKWGFDNPAEIAEYANWDMSELYDRYYYLVGLAARSGYFNIIAHADLIKKFNFRPQGSLTPYYEQTVRILRDTGVATEINTAGWRVPAEEVYPNPELLEMCLHYKVPVTLGSDAHKPDLVANRFTQAVALLRDIGFTQVATFRQGQRRMVPLDF